MRNPLSVFRVETGRTSNLIFTLWKCSGQMDKKKRDFGPREKIALKKIELWFFQRGNFAEPLFFSKFAGHLSKTYLTPVTMRVSAWPVLKTYLAKPTSVFLWNLDAIRVWGLDSFKWSNWPPEGSWLKIKQGIPPPPILGRVGNLEITTCDRV